MHYRWSGAGRSHLAGHLAQWFNHRNFGDFGYRPCEGRAFLFPNGTSYHLGQSLLDAKDIVSGEAMGAEVGAFPLVLGLLAAFFSGIVACNWMIALVKRSQLKYFSFTVLQ